VVVVVPVDWTPAEVEKHVLCDQDLQQDQDQVQELLVQNLEEPGQEPVEPDEPGQEPDEPEPGQVPD